MAFIDSYYEIDFESGLGSTYKPFPAPFGAPDDLIEATRAVIEVRKEAYAAVDKAHDAFDAARRAEADDKTAALEAARDCKGHAPLAPGLLGLAHEADDAARLAVHAAQSAYYAYTDLYDQIMADPERRTAWLARVLPDYEQEAEKLRADFADMRARADRVTAWHRMIFRLAGEPHVPRQTVGPYSRGPITDDQMISHIAALTAEPAWMSLIRDLVAQTPGHDTDKEAA